MNAATIYRRGAMQPMRFGAALAIVCSIGLSCAAAAQVSAPVELRVPVPPSPVTAGGRVHLAWELHITNFAPVPVTVTRVRAGDGRNFAMDFSGEELRRNSRWIGVLGDGPGGENVEIPAGGRVIVFAWMTTTPEAVPASLGQVVSLRWVSSGGDTVKVDLDIGPQTLGPPPAVISPPLRGEDFFAANGPDNATGHRRALIPVSGTVTIAQRFATDWVQIINGRTNVGDRADNSTYHIWGKEALAVADGVVVVVKDGIPENVPGTDSRAVPMTLETLAGNHVVLDIGGGNFAFYAHLQPGSIRVAEGDRIRSGDVIGLVGNSGNSTEPHLHFHVANGASPLGAEGVPFVFDRFTRTGHSTGFGSPIEAVPDQLREREMPLANIRVRFDPRR